MAVNPIYHSQYTAAQIEASIGKTPIIDSTTKTWKVWDIETSAYADTGIDASAQASALDAEAWAVGTRNGEPVSSSDEAYHNNAKWWAEGAADSAEAANDIALKSFVVFEKSGNPVTFDDGADGVPVKALSVGLKATQDLDGYNAPWPPFSKKNLIDPAEIIPERRIDPTGDPVVDVAYMRTGSIPVVAGEEYTFFARDNNDDSTDSISFFNDESPKPATFVSQQTCKGSAAYTVTVPFGVTYAVCSYKLAGTQAQFEHGNTATEYEPGSNVCEIVGKTGVNIVANGTTIPVSFASAGTVYGGTLDVVNGLLTVTHELMLFTQIGDNSQNNITYSGGLIRFSSSALATRFRRGVANTVPIDGLCEIYKPVARGSAETTDLSFSISSSGGTLFFHDSRYDASNYLNILSDNAGYKIMLPYRDSSIYTIQLDKTEIATLLGDNEFSVDADSMDLQYRADPTILYNQIAAAINAQGGNIAEAMVQSVSSAALNLGSVSPDLQSSADDVE